MSSNYLFDDFKPYPIHIVLGDPGAGKSLFCTYLGYLADQEGYNIFANFHLFGFKNFHYIRYYKDYDPKTKKPFIVNDILSGKAEDGTPIKNGIILWDEPQSTGLEAHSFFSRDTIEMARFVSQIRKDDLALILATQRFNFPVYNVRQLVAFIYEIHPTDTKGKIRILRRNYNTGSPVDKFPIYRDLRWFYDKYDSKEKIGVKPDPEDYKNE